MNITIVSNYYYPEIGAAPARITLLAESLSSLGHAVNVICPLPNYPQGRIFKGYRHRWSKKETINEVKVYRYWIFPTTSKNPFLRIVGMLSFSKSLWAHFFFRFRQIQKINLVIIQNSPLLVSFSAIILFKRLFKKKTVLNVSDLWPLSALELGAMQRGRFYSFLEKIEKSNYKKSDLIMAQSNEIIAYIRNITATKPFFLYRNLPAVNKDISEPVAAMHSKPLKIVYAGLLGVAQGVFDIVKAIDFPEIPAELHIFGDGNERGLILEFIKNNPQRGVYYHGVLSRQALHEAMDRNYHAALIPLRSKIYGAVPSKIFETAHFGIPILFSGAGEGANLVENLGLGYASNPGDFVQLQKNIYHLASLNDVEYTALCSRCLSTAREVFDLKKQLGDLDAVLTKL